MNIHKNARLTPYGREVLVRQIVSGQTVEATARAASVCPRTARKWLARFLAEGVEGLQDRSSRPHRLFRPTPPEIVAPRSRRSGSIDTTGTGHHGSLQSKPPITRLALNRDNLLRLHN
jgi:hypothetical protein